MGKHVFVTVGTTKFDPMVEAIDKAAVLSSLSSKGFSSLTAQIGHGDHVPSFPVDPVCVRLRTSAGQAVMNQLVCVPVSPSWPSKIEQENAMMP